MNKQVISSTQQRPVTVVQAHPGFYSLQAWTSDGKLQVTRLPIIAWVVTHDGVLTTIPVTPAGSTLTFDLALLEQAIALPDGRVLYEDTSEIITGNVVEWREMSMDNWLALARDTFDKPM